MKIPNDHPKLSLHNFGWGLGEWILMTIVTGDKVHDKSIIIQNL